MNDTVKHLCRISLPYLRFVRPLPLSDWADEHRYIANGASPEPGLWRTSRTPYMKKILDAITDPLIRQVSICAGVQIGKALSLDTRLPTPSGWTTMGAVREGDNLYDECGRVCSVVFKTPVMENHKCYRITFSDRSSVVADADHRWFVECEYDPNGELRTQLISHGASMWSGVLTTEQIKRIQDLVKGRGDKMNPFRIPVTRPIEMPAIDLPIDPYLLGAWLGDGNTYRCHIYKPKSDLEEIAERIQASGYSVKFVEEKGGAWHISVEGASSVLNALGLLGSKSVPQCYLRASVEQRLALLQGLMDTDGTVTHRGHCEFSNTNEAIANGVYELLVSLGYKPSMRQRVTHCTYKGEVKDCTSWSIGFTAYRDMPVFSLKRKLSRVPSRDGRRFTETFNRRIVSVEEVPSVPVACIEVDSPSHLYLCGDAMIPTHNTECLLSAIAYYMQHDPTTIMLVEPDEKLVTDIGVDRVDSMIRESPELRPLFGITDDGAKSTKRGSMKNHMKRFPGGYLFLASSGSPTALKSRSIRVVLCDEIDTYPMRPDGHPVDLAINRATTFIDSKVVMVSSPTTVQTSEIWRRVGGAGARYEYRIPCENCGEYHAWTWEMVKWDDDDPRTARMECPSCGAIIRGAGAASDTLLGLGDWFLVAGTEGADSVGYIVPGLLSPWKPLSGMVQEWLEANHNRDIDRLRTFMQERLAKPWDATTHVFNPLVRTRFDMQRFEEHPDHSTVRVITAGIDVQGDRIECSIIGWGKAYESWVIEHRIVYGNPLSEETWIELAKFMACPHELSDGRKMRLFAAAVDSGDGETTATVYRFCGKLAEANVIAVKGSSHAEAKMFGAPSQSGAKGAKLYVLGVSRIKEVVFQRLGLAMPGPGYIHVPAEYKGEYWEQLNSEQPEYVTVHGQTEQRWRKNRARNEALDCYVYAYAVYMIFSSKAKASRNVVNTRRYR